MTSFKKMSSLAKNTGNEKRKENNSIHKKQTP